MPAFLLLLADLALLRSACCRASSAAGLNGVGAFRSLCGRAGPPVLSAAVSESASPESLPSVPSELVMAAFAALNASPAQALQMDKGGGVSAAALRAVQLTQHVPFVRILDRYAQQRHCAGAGAAQRAAAPQLFQPCFVGWPCRRTIDLHSCTDKRSYSFFRLLAANSDATWTPVHGINILIALRCHPSFAVSLLIGCCAEQLLLVEIAALLVELQRYW